MDFGVICNLTIVFFPMRKTVIKQLDKANLRLKFVVSGVNIVMDFLEQDQFYGPKTCLSVP